LGNTTQAAKSPLAKKSTKKGRREPGFWENEPWENVGFLKRSFGGGGGGETPNAEQKKGGPRRNLPSQKKTEGSGRRMGRLLNDKETAMGGRDHHKGMTKNIYLTEARVAKTQPLTSSMRNASKNSAKGDRKGVFRRTKRIPLAPIKRIWDRNIR